MSELVQTFDTWPWNVPPGLTFFAIYGAIAAGLLLLTWLLQRGVGRTLDAGAGSEETASFAASSGSKLEPGRIPRGSDLWRVAHLKGGARGVTGALLSSATAEGWIFANEDAKFEAARGRAPVDPLLLELHRAVGGAPKTAEELLAHANAVTAAHRPGLVEDLIRQGHYRSGGARWALAAIALAGGGVTALFGLIRLPVRAALYGGGAPVPVFLMLELIVIAVVTLLLALRTRESSSARAYLRWLEDATQSLRADVASGRRREGWEVGLAVALGGLASAGAITALDSLAPVIALATPSSSSSSSSCSSSSGCGGGCGGGGGCS